MKDRQFMVILALVVATGLVMGLIAFRMTASGPATAAAGPVKAIGGDPNAPRPSAADEQSTDTGSSSPSSTDSPGSDQSASRDGDPPDIATPEPAPPPPPPPPVQPVEVSSDTQS